MKTGNGLDINILSHRNYHRIFIICEGCAMGTKNPCSSGLFLGKLSLCHLKCLSLQMTTSTVIAKPHTRMAKYTFRGDIRNVSSTYTQCLYMQSSQNWWYFSCISKVSDFKVVGKVHKRVLDGRVIAGALTMLSMVCTL